MTNDTGRIDIVKRGGRRPSEEFSAEKLHHSIVAACLSDRTPDGDAEAIARHVCLQVIAWCSQKGEITSSDVRLMASRVLERFHPEAAYLYKHHQALI